MTIAQIVNKEDTIPNKVFMYKEGIFWKLYNPTFVLSCLRLAANKTIKTIESILSFLLRGRLGGAYK